MVKMFALAWATLTVGFPVAIELLKVLISLLLLIPKAVSCRVPFDLALYLPILPPVWLLSSICVLNYMCVFLSLRFV